jgi:hypothetical protein
MSLLLRLGNNEMSKTIRLTEKQISELAYEIGKPVLKFLNKRIEREITKIPDHQNININDFVNLMIITLVNIDSNKLIWLRDYFKSSTKTEMDFVKLISSYVNNLSNLMTADEAKRMRESLN